MRFSSLFVVGALVISALGCDDDTRPGPEARGLAASQPLSAPEASNPPERGAGPRSEHTRAGASDDERLGDTPTPPANLGASPRDRFACRVPAIPISRPRECARGGRYPACKWQMPAAPLSAGRYRRWRNTIVEHWWGRPSLVTFILASLDEFERLHPDQVVAVGDLDAPGPRHQTHDRGVDVDLYVLGALLTENAGGGRYPSNYEGKSTDDVEALRRRVLDLAKILAACSDGAVRIYYNDDVVLERFHAWYDEQGFAENPFGRPMQRHNPLHDFHFHVTIPEDLQLHPMEPLAEGTEHPIARIEPPPPPGSAPHLSSRVRRPGAWAAVPRD